MKTLTPYLSFGLIIGLTILSGAVQGRLRNRWGAAREISAAGRALKAVPEHFGDWRLESSQSIDDRTLATLECADYVLRTYCNQRTLDRVVVAVLLGPAGPISVHNPEVCYSSRDHTVVQPRSRVALQNKGGEDDELWAMTFRSNDVDGTIQRVYFGWSTGGPWSAPENLRFHSAGYPYLYKLQLACRLPPGVKMEEQDPCHAFLRAFLPALKSCLVEQASR